MNRVLRFMSQNAVAFLALFVALGGTSYAAVQLKNNSVKSRHIAPDAVTTSDIKNGAVKGPKLGANAVDSTKVAEGSLTGGDVQDGGLAAVDLAPGTLPPAPGEPLPSGATMYGFMNVDVQVATAGGDWRAAGSYPMPLTDPIVTRYIDNVTPGETCEGTVSNPTAPPGTLCVYPVGTSNPSEETNSHAFATNTRFGFSISWSPPNTGDSLFNAVWAVTAP